MNCNNSNSPNWTTSMQKPHQFYVKNIILKKSYPTPPPLFWCSYHSFIVPLVFKGDTIILPGQNQSGKSKRFLHVTFWCFHEYDRDGSQGKNGRRNNDVDTSFSRTLCLFRFIITSLHCCFLPASRDGVKAAPQSLNSSQGLPGAASSFSCSIPRAELGQVGNGHSAMGHLKSPVQPHSGQGVK